ncbi:MAG: hypothetical protein CMB97_08445 [Flavobacteriaceae bacterium]|nr:hypothetical protein [Flavobacteriaceae bacterium]
MSVGDMKCLVDDFYHRCPKTGLVLWTKIDYTLGTGGDSKSSVEQTNYYVDYVHYVDIPNFISESRRIRK